jgi:hypothetical protein
MGLMETRVITEASLKKKLDSSSNVLLVNPPVADLRLPWAKWHQPVGLLQVGAYLLTKKKNVKLIDFLHYPDVKRYPRTKIASFNISNYVLPIWLFGVREIEQIFRTIKRETQNWKPDLILITSLNTIWWKQAQYTIYILKKVFPGTTIILGGAYPKYETNHAKQFSKASSLFTDNPSFVQDLAPAIELYDNPPKSAAIFFYGQGKDNILVPRKIHEIVQEIKGKIHLGVTEVVFIDESIKTSDVGQLETLLGQISKANIKVKIVFQGNLTAGSISETLAKKLMEANTQQIYLKCNLDLNSDQTYTDTIDDYVQCIRNLVTNGYDSRSGQVTAMLALGIPYENLNEVARRAIDLSHYVGSVIPVPFQYVFSLHRKFTFGRETKNNGSNKIDKVLFSHKSKPELLNGKLFPFAEISHADFEEYVELIRLIALLNSKFRGKTFDFLSSSLTSELFRESIKTEGWDPFNQEESTIILEDALIVDNVRGAKK